MQIDYSELLLLGAFIFVFIRWWRSDSANIRLKQMNGRLRTELKERLDNLLREVKEVREKLTAH